jgi:deoxycytidylate deaminase
MQRSLSKFITMVRFANDLAGLSVCDRDKVGAIVVPPDFSNVWAIGYNGPSSGAPHACRGTEGDCGCSHAEANAVVKLSDHPRTGVMFTTRMPCERCAQLIVNCQKVQCVVWEKPYRNDLGVVALAHGRVNVLQLRPLLSNETLWQFTLTEWRTRAGQALPPMRA